MRRKACRTCGVEKTLRQFYCHPTTADGRLSECKVCKRAYEAESYRLKREQRIAAKRFYGRSEVGKSVRKRYLANGGQTLHNENRRMLRRIRKLEQVGA